MVSFEISKEKEKNVFCLVTCMGQRKNSESPWGIKPDRTLDSTLWCSTTEPQRLLWVRSFMKRSIMKFLPWFLMGTQNFSLSYNPDNTKTSFSSSMEVWKRVAVCSTTQLWKFFKYRCCHPNLSRSCFDSKSLYNI